MRFHLLTRDCTNLKLVSSYSMYKELKTCKW